MEERMVSALRWECWGRGRTLAVTVGVKPQ